MPPSTRGEPAEAPVPPPTLSFTSAGSGPAVLLLHGQPGTGAAFFRLQPLLAQAGLQAIAVDRPGYGRTGGSAVGFTENARRAFSLLDGLGIDEVTVFGHSWSGGSAIAMALQQPERVRGLILQGSVGGTGSVTFADRMLALPVLGALAMGAGLRATALTLPRDRIRRRLAPELDGVPPYRLAAMAMVWGDARTARAVAHEQQRLIDELPALTARLPEVRTPAIVLVGRADKRVSVASQLDLAHRLPGAELSQVPGGHLLAIEAAEVVVSAVLRVTPTTG